MAMYSAETRTAARDGFEVRAMAANLIDAAIRPLTALSRELRRRQSERLLSSLPFEIRKDIGYRGGNGQYGPSEF